MHCNALEEASADFRGGLQRVSLKTSFSAGATIALAIAGERPISGQ